MMLRPNVAFDTETVVMTHGAKAKVYGYILRKKKATLSDWSVVLAEIEKEEEAKGIKGEVDNFE